MNILIVEDDPKVRVLYEEQFVSLGHDVTLCPDAGTALETCQETLYALIVLDLGLPDMDGIELCRRIRALPQGEQGMILVITGRDEAEDLHKVLEAGANDYLRKPVSLTQLSVRLTIIEEQFHNLIARKEAEEAHMESLIQIEQAKQEWEATADSLSHVVCLLDRQGRIMRANRTIEYWNLGRVEQVKGKAFYELLHPHCKQAACYLKDLLSRARDKVAQGESLEYETEDKQLQRWLNIQIRPISFQTAKKHSQTVRCTVVVLTDISAQKELQETLSKQDRLLLGVAGAMNHLLITPDFSTAITNALRTLASAADADRVYIYENHAHPKTQELLMSQRFEWDRFSNEAQINSPTLQNIFYKTGFQRWYDVLSDNLTIASLVQELPKAEQELLAAQNIMSILLVPITIDDQLWGFIGFDDCHAKREWRGEEESVLVAMAGSIGGAIARERMDNKLRQTSLELRSVFQSLPDECFRLSADGSILDYKINQGAELFNPESFIGQWTSGLLSDDVVRQLDTAIQRVRTTKKLLNLEYKLPGPGVRYEEIRLLPFLEDQLLGMARDITERKQAEEDVKKHRAQLEQRLKKASEQLKQEVRKRKQLEETLQKLKQQLKAIGISQGNLATDPNQELRRPPTTG